jgi:RNA polymerase sigma-70 factor (ECF subfamily)
VDEAIKRVMTGEVHAFREIVDAHRAAVFAFFAGNLADHHLAEDLTQDTLVAAYQNLATIGDTGRLESWLLSIARNKLMSHLRQFYRSGGAADIVTSRIEYELIAETDRLDGQSSEMIARLRECVDRHADDEQAILRSRYFNNEPVQDIAKRLGTTAGALSVHLHRLRRQLRACMEGRVA